MTRRRTLAASGLLFLLGATALLLGTGSHDAQAFPFPSPIYQILATSGTHTASLLNLPLGQPGVPQVPVPVDVDGDLLPDVTMSVNLIEIGGVISNPPNPASILQPNVQIDRLLTAPLLGQKSVPLRIQAQLRLAQFGSGSGPDTYIRFGYDTGPGGSIPPTFKAVLGGLPQLFNPLSATVDTGPLAGKPISYEGPLKIVGQIQTGPSVVDLGFGFSPFPTRLQFTYASDDDGTTHLTYAHSAPTEVDLDAHVDIVDADSAMHLAANIERLPGQIAVAIGDGGSDGGDITFASDSDGRRPDARVHLESTSTDAGTKPMVADIGIDSLPQNLAARWSLPEVGPIVVNFDADGQGIGGVDVDIRNHLPTAPGALPAFVPTQQQYLSVQQSPSPTGDTYQRIMGRVERVRHVDFSNDGVDGGVLAAYVSMGDGEKPLQVAYDCSVACSSDGTTQATDVDATVSPLPSTFGITLDGADSDEATDDPMVIDYTASTPTDVDGHIRIVGEHGTAASACGDLSTTCADLLVRDVPTDLTATITDAKTDVDSTMAVDLQLGDGTLPPDLAGTITMGPSDPDDAGARPTVAVIDARQLPDHASVLVHSHVDPDTELPKLDHAKFDACDADDATDCVLGSGIGDLTVEVRNFVDRPATFPVAPPPTTPVYANITQRGDDFALQARFTDLRRVELIDNGSILGLQTDIGDGSAPFAAAVDIQGSPLGDDVVINEGDDEATPPVAPIVIDDALQDLAATARVDDLPAHFELCMRSPNEALITTGAGFTETCEHSPFDDAAQPLAIAYDLGAPAKVSGSFSRSVEGTNEADGTHYEELMGGNVDIPNLPSHLTTHVILPPEGTEGPIHAIYDAAAGIDQLTVGFHSTVGDDVVCMDPRDPVTAMCLSATVTAIPRYLEMSYDPTKGDDNLLFQARSLPPGDPGIPTPILDRPDVTDLTLSSVAPDADTGKQRALLVTGVIEDLPITVHGTLHLPETPDEPTAIQFCASADPCGPDATPGEPIGRINVDARNVVVADPTPLADDDPSNDEPPQRAIEGGVLPDPTDSIILYQRGEAFHARLDISDIRGAGYRTGVAESGKPSGTQVLNLDLKTDPAPVLRAFVDLDAGTSHLIGDATLSGIAPATVMCFRGADLDPDDDPDAAAATFCDTRPTKDEGAFELSTLPGQDTTGLDVDAFVRQSTGGDADILASRVRLTDVPAYVRGTFPAQGHGSLDVRGYDADEQPKGFGVIDAEVATFDLRAGAAGDGYPANATPFTRQAPEDGAGRAPAPAPGHQHLALVYSGDNLNARARIFGLQQLAMRDGTCDSAAHDPGAVTFGDRADHPTYPTPPDGEHPYTCVRTVVDTGAGQPMDLSIKVDTTPPEGGRPQILSLTDAQLTAVPSAMELVLADRPDVSANINRPEPCPTVGSGDNPPFDCMPAMIRFDQTGAGQIVGQLRVGDVADLRSVDAIVPGGNDADKAAFAGIHDLPAGNGMRVAAGLYAKEDEPSRFAAVGKFRLDVPGSLTVDAPDSASGENYTDFRFHYAVRDEQGDVVPSLGDLLVLLEQGDGAQIEASGDGNSGAQIPGELALAVYLRDSISTGQTLMQIDGVTSTSLDLNAVMLTPHETGLDPEQAAVLGVASTPLTDRKAFQLLHLAPGPFTDWYHPSFRAQVEILDSPYVPPGPYGPGTTDDDSCSAIDCSESYARVKEIRASFDMNPVGAAGNRTRLVRIALDIRTSEKGGEIRAFDDVNAPLGAQGNAEVSASANISIDPVKIYVFKGIPFLGNLEVDIDLSIDVGFQLDRVNTFLFGNDGIHIEAQAIGSGNASAIGPVNVYPHEFFAGVQGPFNITVAGLEYTGDIFNGPGDSGEEPLELDFASCQAGDLLAGFTPVGAISQGAKEFLDQVDLSADNSVPLSEDTSVVVLPQSIDSNFTKYGLGNLVTDLFKPIINGIACAATNVDLRPILDDQIPATPVDAQIPGRPVPPEVVMNAPVAEPTPPPAVVDATLPGGTMCGAHQYKVLHITGPITVAGTPGPSCPANSVSSLSLSAEEIYIDPGGSIDASAIVTGGCTADSINATYPPDRGPLDSIDDCASYLTSNDGAPHVEDGGVGGRSSSFSGPDDYSDSFLGITSGGYNEAGYRGGGAEGGRGGGTIGLSADRIVLQGDVLANGGDGGDGGGGPCAGSGGGSAGSVVIDASYVGFEGGEIHADGGHGGNGGGGGSAGEVLLSSGKLADYDQFVSATVSPGLGSATADCTGFDPDDGIFGGPSVDEEIQAKTSLLGLGEFWQTDNQADGSRLPDDDDLLRDFVGIDLPFRSSVADFGAPYQGVNQNPYALLLCDVDFDTSFTSYQQGLAIFFPYVDSDWRADPCGTNPLVVDGDSDGYGDDGVSINYVERKDIPAGGDEIQAADGEAFDGVSLGNGYHGLYTRAFVSLSPVNDCFDDDYFGDPLNPTPVTDFERVDGHDSDQVLAAGVFDYTFCAPAESLPPAGQGSPELLIGVDDSSPNLTLTPLLPSEQEFPANPPNTVNPSAYSANQVVRFTTAADDLVGNVRLAGLDSVVCYTESSFGSEPSDLLDAVDCGGPDPWEVNLVDTITNVVVARATDELGNWREARWNVRIDEEGPEVTIFQEPPDPDTVRANGWFSESPDYRIGDFADNESGPKAGVFMEYRVDDGPTHPCPEDPAMPGTCKVDHDDLPLDGRHVLHAFGIDLVGNRTGAGVFFGDPDVGETTDIKVDHSDPTSGAFVAPLEPSGANGWWNVAPWLGVVGFDRPVGGSGFEPLPGETVADPSVAYLKYSVDGGSFADWNGPFRLGDGDHTVCSEAKDLAGNPWQADPVSVCTTTPIRIDTTAPAATLSATGPLGGGGWYTDPVTVTAAASDAGSGIHPLVAPSGLWVSVDGGGYASAAGPITLGEGAHVVRAYAVDVAGNRSVVAERVVRVDRSKPVSVARTTPPAPARNGWFREQPVVTLRATDGAANAGVASIKWCYGVACVPSTVYTGPFTAPAGTTVLRWQSVDASGAANIESVQELTLRVDTAPPTVKATQASTTLWSRTLADLGLGPKTVGLQYQISDDRSGPLTVTVVVFDTLGTAVRHIYGGTINVAPGATYSGAVQWGGQNDTLSGLVPLGIYHYRVIVTDEAGNVAESGESRTITIKLL